MTDYNDGKWHGWNGGECPVHPRSLVDFVFDSGGEQAFYEHIADTVYWTYGVASSEIIAFRVTKPYIEPPKPREFWVSECNGYAYDDSFSGAIHVREVLPND